MHQDVAKYSCNHRAIFDLSEKVDTNIYANIIITIITSSSSRYLFTKHADRNLSIKLVNKQQDANISVLAVAVNAVNAGAYPEIWIGGVKGWALVSPPLPLPVPPLPPLRSRPP